MPQRKREGTRYEIVDQSFDMNSASFCGKLQSVEPEVGLDAARSPGAAILAL
jgi:hypothetical protein